MIASNGAIPCLLTIGHSDHEMSAFLSLLKRHGVSAIADVRSQPYSRFHGQFNRETLSELLGRADIQYVYLGRELGARRLERESYLGAQARYELVARLPAFVEGLEGVRRRLETQRLALLCAEKDPITCHRTILICRHLRSDAIDIRHILHDGSTEGTDQIESRLLDAVGLPSADLFRSRAELIEEAYDLQGKRIAFTESQSAETSGVIP